MSTVIEPIDAVRAGAKFLDEQQPGWECSIDLDDLEMSDCVHCVLGQVYGYFDDGLENLHIDHTKAFELGFDTTDVDDERAYDQLGDVWHHEVLARTNV